MAYRDPYTEPGRLENQRQYDDPQDFNSYPTSQPHQTYDHGELGPSYDNFGPEYRDDPQHNRESPRNCSHTH